MIGDAVHALEERAAFSAGFLSQIIQLRIVSISSLTGRFEREYNHEEPSEWTLRNLKAAGYTDVAADHFYMRGITADSGRVRLQDIQAHRYREPRLYDHCEPR